MGAVYPPDLRGLVDQVNLTEPQRQERISCRIGVGGVLYVEIGRAHV